MSRWSSFDLAAQAVTEDLVEAISSSTVRRWLHADVIKPWRYRSWIFPRDPEFASKAARVLDLYARMWDGVPLGADEYVISADEKSQLQALARCHRGLPPGPRRPRRVEFEYERGGTLAYMGAYDVHAARLTGMVAPKTGIVPFMELVDRVLTGRALCEGPRRLLGRRQRVIARRPEVGRPDGGGMANARLVHLPVHASWLNQIEIVFSVIQRKVVKPADFADLGALADRLERFENRYKETARPFDWRFTSSDLAVMLERLEAHRLRAEVRLAA